MPVPLYKPPPLPAPTRAVPSGAFAKPQSHVFKWILLGSVLFFVLGGLVLAASLWIGMKKMKDYGYDTELGQRHPQLAVAIMVLKQDPNLEIVEIDKIVGSVTFKRKNSGRAMRLRVVNGQLRTEAVLDAGNEAPGEEDEDEELLQRLNGQGPDAIQKKGGKIKLEFNRP